MDALHPHTKVNVAEMLAALSVSRTPVQIVGGRQDIGRALARAAAVELWTTQLDRVIAYDPAEMLAVVEAGMRIHELDALLADGGQEWPVDAHPDATVGGVIAAGLSGMRRLRTGLMRDSVVELELVTGDGRLIRSGARTVKNVTGFDVHRLATGSFGSLGAIVQVAIKVRPRPAARRTLITAEGGVALADALLAGVPLPAAVIAGPDHVEVLLEGWPGEVEEQTEAVRQVTGAFEIHEDRAITRVDELWPDDPIVVEAGVPPSQIAGLVEGAERWRGLMGVGLVWLPFAPASGANAWTPVRGIPAAPHEPGPADEIAARLRSSFDPAGILS